MRGNWSVIFSSETISNLSSFQASLCHLLRIFQHAWERFASSESKLAPDFDVRRWSRRESLRLRSKRKFKFLHALNLDFGSKRRVLIRIGEQDKVLHVYVYHWWKSFLPLPPLDCWMPRSWVEVWENIKRPRRNCIGRERGPPSIPGERQLATAIERGCQKRPTEAGPWIDGARAKARCRPGGRIRASLEAKATVFCRTKT